MDNTENIRREMVQEINENPISEKGRLEQIYGVGNVFDTAELQQHFKVEGFLAPFVSVIRKADGKKGALTFQHSPRFYFDFR